MSCGCSFPQRPPTFNLVCDVYNGGLVPPLGAPRIAALPCQLVFPQLGVALFGAANSCMYLLVPAHSQIKMGGGLGVKDLIELPIGSACFYTAEFVDDRGTGFANAHRVVILAHALPFPDPKP